MLATLLLGAVLGSSSQAEGTSILLPNGMRGYVDAMGEPGQAAVAVSFCFHGLGPAAESGGGVHLLEHLLAPGPKRELDARFESQGLILVAKTSRDVVTFSVSCGPGQVEMALREISALVTNRSLSEAAIKREQAIMAEELAAMPVYRRLVQGSYRAAFGDAAPSSFGDLKQMAALDSAALTGIANQLFTARRASVAVTGFVDEEVTSGWVREIFAELPAGNDWTRESPELLVEPSIRLVDEAWGEARAVPVGGVDTTDCLSSLAAAMGLAAQLNHPLPVYKPSRLGGLVVLTSTRRVGLSEVDALSSGERRSVSALGLNLLRGWARSLNSQPLAYAELQASLRAQDRLLNIDRIQQAVGLVTQSNVLSKVASFGKEEAIVVEGRK